MREEGGVQDGPVFNSGLGNCDQGAFCCSGKRNVAWVPLGRGDSRFCFRQVEFEVSQGHPEMEILNEQLKIWVWSSREEWCRNTFAHCPYIGVGETLGQGDIKEQVSPSWIHTGKCQLDPLHREMTNTYNWGWGFGADEETRP